MRVSILTFLLLIMLSAFSMSRPVVAQFGTLPGGTLPPDNKLLVIGDSLTSGLYASHEQATFVSLLGKKTVYKIGRTHASMLPQAVIAWQGGKAWQPNIVVIEIGLNDVARGTMTLADWKVEYSELIVDIQSTGAKVVLCTTFWAGLKKEHPDYHWYLEYNQTIRDLAEQHNTALADLWSATLDCSDCVSNSAQLSYWGPHYHGDGFHPNDQGHALIAQTIINALVALDEDVYFFPIVRG